MDTKKVGKFGEKIAENYLKKKGYQILDRNFVFRIPGDLQRGEIDIVAKKKDIFSFFEVKFLKVKEKGAFPFFPEDKINFSKKRKLKIAAESWLIKNKVPLNSKWQIDVIAIKLNPDKKMEIFHFENAISY